MDRTNIIGILDVIEDETFLRPTAIASGHQTVADIIGESPEVRLLLDHKTDSLPLMQARYRERDREMADGIRLVYFVVFGLAHDREMISDIISYLKSCRGVPPSELLWPWHPFFHGIKALEKITRGQVKAPPNSGSMEEFDQFLAGATKWAETQSVH